MRSLSLMLMIGLSVNSFAQSDAGFREYNKTFTTYPFSNPNPVPDPASISYPYFRYDGFTDKAVQKEWKVVELENDFIKLMILPQVGGKIWTAIDKKKINHLFMIMMRSSSATSPCAGHGRVAAWKPTSA